MSVLSGFETSPAVQVWAAASDHTQPQQQDQAARADLLLQKAQDANPQLILMVL